MLLWPYSQLAESNLEVRLRLDITDGAPSPPGSSSSIGRFQLAPCGDETATPGCRGARRHLRRVVHCGWCSRDLTSVGCTEYGVCLYEFRRQWSGIYLNLMHSSLNQGYLNVHSNIAFRMVRAVGQSVASSPTSVVATKDLPCPSYHKMRAINRQQKQIRRIVPR
jgi:hypothetical protein